MTEEQQESMQKSHPFRRMDNREESRYNKGCGKIREECESSEVLYRATHLACDNRCRRSRRHDKTHHQSLRKNGIMSENHDAIIRREGQRQLHHQNNPVPAMQAKVKRIDFAEREEEHEENQPRQQRLQRQQPSVAENTDKHREPESVTVKRAFDI